MIPPPSPQGMEEGPHSQNIPPFPPYPHPSSLSPSLEGESSELLPPLACICI